MGCPDSKQMQQTPFNVQKMHL